MPSDGESGSDEQGLLCSVLLKVEYVMVSTSDRWVSHRFLPGPYGKSRSMVGVGVSLVGVSSVVVRWAWAKGGCQYEQLHL